MEYKITSSVALSKTWLYLKPEQWCKKRYILLLKLFFLTKKSFLYSIQSRLMFSKLWWGELLTSGFFWSPQENHLVRNLQKANSNWPYFVDVTNFFPEATALSSLLQVAQEKATQLFR